MYAGNRNNEYVFDSALFTNQCECHSLFSKRNMELQRNDYKKIISGALKKARTKKNISQKSAGDKLGVDRTSISNYENGKDDIPGSSIPFLMEYYGAKMAAIDYEIIKYRENLKESVPVKEECLTHPSSSSLQDEIRSLSDMETDLRTAKSFLNDAVECINVSDPIKRLLSYRIAFAFLSSDIDILVRKRILKDYGKPVCELCHHEKDEELVLKHVYPVSLYDDLKFFLSVNELTELKELLESSDNMIMAHESCHKSRSSLSIDDLISNPPTKDRAEKLSELRVKMRPFISLKKDTQEKLATKQFGRCMVCGKLIHVGRLNADHIICKVDPYKIADFDNLQLLCRSCNATKYPPKNENFD